MSGKYEMFFCPEISVTLSFRCKFETLKEAAQALNTIADYTLFIQDKGLMRDHTNFGGVHAWDDELEAWCDVDDDEIEEDLSAEIKK